MKNALIIIEQKRKHQLILVNKNKKIFKIKTGGDVCVGGAGFSEQNFFLLHIQSTGGLFSEKLPTEIGRISQRFFWYLTR